LGGRKNAKKVKNEKNMKSNTNENLERTKGRKFNNVT